MRARLGRSRRLGWGPLIQGIVNVTPDSFSDGGRFSRASEAVAHGARLWQEGADWLDVGGESTRPGAAPVPEAEELRRVVPVVSGLRSACPASVISVDTSKPGVAEAALDAGATVINDVSGGRDPRMLELAAGREVRLILMHSRGTPATMQGLTDYDDLVAEVVAALEGLRRAAVAAGVDPERIVLDPGVGFAKRPGANPKLFSAISRLRALGSPVLIGASRKRFIGDLTGVTVAADRVAGSLGAAVAAAHLGADALRVHDVAATIHALKVFRACVDA